MSVLLDLQGIQSREHGDRGIGRYLLELARALERFEPNAVSRFVLNPHLPVPARVRAVASGERLVFNDRLDGPPERVYHVGSPAEVSVSLDDLWPGSAQSMRLVVSLYDLIPRVFTEIYNDDPVVRRKYEIRLELVRRADRILAISRATAADAIEYLGIPSEKVVDVGAGVAEHFRPPADRDAAYEGLRRTMPGIEPRYLLYTGGIDPRKNIDGLLCAYAALPAELRARHQLLVVCRVLPEERTDIERRLAELRIADRVSFPGSVPDETLVFLYQAAELFVFPSLYEGFGFPVAEAIACGAPVIASNTSAMVELVADPDARFDPLEARSIREAIERCLTDRELFERLRSVRLDARHTWPSVARRTATAYEDVERLPARRRVNDRRRVAFVTPLPPQRSGVADESYRLLGALTKHCEVHAFVDGGDPAGARAPAGVEVKSVARFDTSDRALAGYDTVFYALGNSVYHGEALSLLRRRPGVVIAHDVRLNDLYAWCAQQRPDLEPRSFQEVLRSLYADRLPDSLGADGQLALEDADRHGVFMAREAIAHAERFLVHSRHAAELARREAAPGHDGKVEVIPYATVSPEEFEPRAASHGPPLVATFGLVSPAKQVSKVVEAFAHVLPRIDARLAIVGAHTPPSERERLAEQAAGLGIADWVQQTGELDAERNLLDWMTKATVAVQLRPWSNGETSASIARCLAAGLPTIVSDVGSSAELPDECVVKVGRAVTAETLGDSIADLLEDPDRRAQMAAASIAYARDRSFDSVASRLYEEIVVGGSPSARRSLGVRRSPRHPGPFIVFGMGRSGSSYVANALHRSGYRMGEELKAPDGQNEAGYYEDLETLRLHESWLAERGLDLGTVSERFPIDPTDSMRAEVAALVARREARPQPWGAKPPGVLFFWPAWREALPAPTVLLLPFRHPEAVAKSYLTPGDTRERALALWLQLNKLALRAIDAGPFKGVLLDFDAPDHLIRQLGRVVGSPLDDVYRPDLHHHRSDDPLDGEIGELYAELRRRAGTDGSEELPDNREVDLGA
ncbi:MAG TPA: glycosyltransferase [Gaiellaceae bacterium]|nr:glycosyltransferase [Gaiellaceae bacterium]